MSSITGDLRFHLPNHKYLQLVATCLLQLEVGLPLLDPFALDVPEDKVEGVYVKRREVEDEIRQLGTQVVIGPTGCGKTTLFNRLSTLLPRQTLVTRLSLAELAASIPETPPENGQIHSQTSVLLVQRIFDTYWEKLLQDASLRSQHIPHLRRDRQWMTKLRWFYQNYPPLHPEMASEFELMAWLTVRPAQAPSSTITAQETLGELVRWVTSPIPQQPRPGVRAYQPFVRVQVGLDQKEALEKTARVLQEIQRLGALYPGRLDLKIFAGSSWDELVHELPSVRRGRVRIYHLPRWRSEELRHLLHRRLVGQKPGDYSDESIQPVEIAQPAQVHEQLAEHFNEQEIRTLCFRLGLDYDDLAAHGRDNKARELVGYMARRGRLIELTTAIKRERPNISDEDAPTSRENRAFSPSMEQPSADYNWGRYLPDTLLEPAAKSQLVNVIIRGALRAYDLGDELDAPIHALRLARGLLAACAGCWADSGYDRPLGVAQLEALTDLYWVTTKED